MKRRIFIVIISLLVLFNLGCKKSEVNEGYDIRGAWELIFTAIDPYTKEEYTLTRQITFTGTKSTGQVDGIGSYTVTGNQIIFTFILDDVISTYTGSFSNGNQMAGTLTFIYPDGNNQTVTGTWTASR